MMKHRNLVGIAVLAAAVSLSACSSNATSSSTTTSHPSGTNAAAPSGGSFCGALVNESADAGKLTTNFAQSIASGNFSSAQQTLKGYFAQVGQDLAKVESTMSSAPANVQSALQVFNNWFRQAQTAVSNATSMQELGQSFTSLSSDSHLAAASKTVGDYVNSQCGTITTTT